MGAEHLLSIDVGTQSVRAMIFDRRGTLLHKGRIPLEPYPARRPGWAEQEAGVFYERLCQACHSLWRDGRVSKKSLIGVALTTQRATVVNVDEQGTPLRPAIVWLDRRRAEGLPPLPGALGLLLRLPGVASVIADLRAEAEISWIQQQQPEIWARTHKLLFLSGYITYRLVGRFVDSVGCQVGYVPFDYRRLDWARPWDWRWRVLHVQRRRLPELVPPGGALGEISQQAAAETGIPAGLPLVAAAADKACEVLGSGAMEPDVACLSLGTTSTVNVTSPRYAEAVRWVPPFPSAVPGAYNLEFQIYRGHWMVSWFRQEFGLPEEQLARDQGCAPEELFEDLALATEPGAMGLLLQPYWSRGVRLPGPEAKGAIIGFGEVHCRAHLYRAILEGLTYALREGLERIERRLGTPAEEIRASGGGSQSDAALQIAADIIDRPVCRMHVYETAGLGAAMDAAVGLGLHPGFAAAVREMTRVARVFRPRPELRRRYEALYRRVYLELYPRLQPLYREIQRITGYPPAPRT